MQIQISWLLQKPTDLDLHCLQRQSISGFRRTRVNLPLSSYNNVERDVKHQIIILMTKCIFQLSTSVGFLLDSMFDFAERFNKLCLSDDEIALFSAVVLLSPGRKCFAS